jgi:hypothetical protein
MSLEDLGNIGEFVAAIAVLVSLVYLALQIRQNTRAVRAGAHQAMADGISALSLTLSESSDLARIMVKGHADYDSLTLEERVRFDAFVGRVFASWENVFFQRQEGLVGPDMWEAWDEAYCRIVSAPVFARFWEAARGGFLRDFQQHVEGKRLSAWKATEHSHAPRS